MHLNLTRNNNFFLYRILFLMTSIQLLVNLFFPGSWNNEWSNSIGINILQGVAGWEGIVEVHKTITIFAGRVFTTYLLDFANSYLGISRLIAYITLSTIAFFLCGTYLIKICTVLKKSINVTALSVVLFYLTFTNLFHQMTPIYTYDDPFQLLFIMMGTYFVLKSNFFAVLICGFLASYVRETTVLIFPGWILLSWFQKKDFKRSFYIALSLFIAGIIYLIANHYTQSAVGVLKENIDYIVNERGLGFLRSNFRSLVATGSTIGSFLNVVLFPIGIIVIYRKRFSNEVSLFLIPFFVVFLINTPIVFTLAKTRESRLFTLPMVFLWPVYGDILISWVKNIRKYNSVLMPFIIGIFFYISFIVLLCFERNLEFSRFLLVFSHSLFLASNYIYNKNRLNGDLI